MAKKKVDAKYAAECRKFLAEVSAQPDVREVSQGVLMKYIEQGTGEVCPRANNVVTVKYRGTLIDGTEFDSNMNDGYPAAFRLKDLIVSRLANRAYSNGGWRQGDGVYTIGNGLWRSSRR